MYSNIEDFSMLVTENKHSVILRVVLTENSQFLSTETTFGYASRSGCVLFVFCAGAWLYLSKG